MMNTLWKITKAGLVVSLLFICGQVPVGKRTVGGHLVHSIYEAIVWVGTSLKESEWFAKMSDSEKTTQHSAPKPTSAPAPIKSAPERSVLERAPLVAVAPKVDSESISPSDRDSLLQLLEE